jgi:hypothetical protein
MLLSASVTSPTSVATKVTLLALNLGHLLEPSMRSVRLSRERCGGAATLWKVSMNPPCARTADHLFWRHHVSPTGTETLVPGRQRDRTHFNGMVSSFGAQAPRNTASGDGCVVAK